MPVVHGGGILFRLDENDRFMVCAVTPDDAPETKSVTVVEGDTTRVRFVNKRKTFCVSFRKVDAETGGEAQNGAVLSGAARRPPGIRRTRTAGSRPTISPAAPAGHCGRSRRLYFTSGIRTQTEPEQFQNCSIL